MLSNSPGLDNLKHWRLNLLLFLATQCLHHVVKGDVFPANLADDNGNKANKESVITWAPLPHYGGYSAKYPNSSQTPGSRLYQDMVSGFLSSLYPTDMSYGTKARPYLGLIPNLSSRKAIPIS